MYRPTDWQTYANSAKAANLNPMTLKLKRGAWLDFASWLNSAHPEISDLADVTRKIAEEYLRDYRANHAPMTCNLRLYNLRDIFRVILAERDIAANPWTLVEPCAGIGHTRRELTVDEVRRLMLAAAREGAEWRILFMVAACTGLRLGDCCRLRWSHIDLKRGIIQLIPEKTRRYSRGRPITVPINAQLMETLTGVPAERRCGEVIPHIAEMRLMRRSSLSRMLTRIFEAAGIRTCVRLEGRRAIPEATFHSLRHSFVSFAANAGVPLVVVQAIVGHTSSAMTRHYYHANEAALRSAVNAVPSLCNFVADAAIGS